MTNFVSVPPALPQPEAGNVSSLSPAAFFKPPQPARRMLQIPQSPSSSLVSSYKKIRGRETVEEKEQTQPQTENQRSRGEIKVKIKSKEIFFFCIAASYFSVLYVLTLPMLSVCYY